MQSVSHMKSSRSAAAKSQQQKSYSPEVVTELCTTLANEYVLLLKTQNFHWNVEGPLFFSLHKLLESQYEELQEFVDRVAEVIRAHDQRSPGTFQEFNKLATIQDSPPTMISAGEMVDTLSKDHEMMAASLRESWDIAEEAEDISSVVLYEDLISFHEKAAWMIRSHNR